MFGEKSPVRPLPQPRRLVAQRRLRRARHAQRAALLAATDACDAYRILAALGDSVGTGAGLDALLDAAMSARSRGRRARWLGTICCSNTPTPHEPAAAATALRDEEPAAFEALKATPISYIDPQSPDYYLSAASPIFEHSWEPDTGGGRPVERLGRIRDNPALRQSAALAPGRPRSRPAAGAR